MCEAKLKSLESRIIVVEIKVEPIRRELNEEFRNAQEFVGIVKKRKPTEQMSADKSNLNNDQNSE